MTEDEFKHRTKDIAIRTIKVAGTLPKTIDAEIIGKQIVRSATSVGANYRAACRAKSTADIINKLAIVEEEADETLYWLELLIESGLVTEAKLSKLMSDVNEIVAMTVASIRTLKTRMRTNPKSKI